MNRQRSGEVTGPDAAGDEGEVGRTGGKTEGKTGSEKVAATSAGEKHKRDELSPNLDRLTVGQGHSGKRDPRFDR